MSPSNEDHDGTEHGYGRFDDQLYSSVVEDDDDTEFLEGTAEDFDLSGEPDPTREFADIGVLREALKNYKAESLRFAEEQSAGMPAPRVNKVVALWDTTPRWALASTAVLALACTAVFTGHRHSEPAPVAMAAAPTAQALSDDNRLLLSVDQALSRSLAPSEEELGLTTTSRQSTKQGRVTN